MGTIHFLDVGCADATVISTGTTTFLVDCEKIGEHAALLPSDKVLRGVFITHQHYDHFSGLQYLRDTKYKIEYLIYSPYERRYDDASVQLDEWREFQEHREYFERQGTKMCHPFRQTDKFKEPWWAPHDGVRFWLLGPFPATATSETRELHDACLVFRADLGARKCLFTGDASDATLAEVARETTHICDDILHASHHGSLNGAEENFIKKSNATFTVISTAEGVHDSVPHPDALKLYKKYTAQQIYRTDEGTWKFAF